MTYLAFDMDGTLYDCSTIILTAFQRGIQDFEENTGKTLPIVSKEIIMSNVGIPTNNIFQNLFPGLNNEEYMLINDLCQSALIEDVMKKKGILYDGVTLLLNDLHKKGYTLFIASNGKLRYLNAILDTYNIHDFFEKEIVVINDTIKTKDDIVAYYKKKYCQNDLLIMIGDRFSDFNAAKSNKIPFIGCTFGHATIEEVQGTPWIAESIKDIPVLIEKIEKNCKRQIL